MTPSSDRWMRLFLLVVLVNSLAKEKWCRLRRGMFIVWQARFMTESALRPGFLVLAKSQSSSRFLPLLLGLYFDSHACFQGSTLANWSMEVIEGDV